MMNHRLLTALIFLVVPAIIMARYPFIRNLTVTSVNYTKGCVIVTGTMDVLFTKQAWTEFGYKNGNFYWFNLYWQHQVGKTFWHCKLVAIHWTLVKHTPKYDKLAFIIVLKPQ
jgi:hypothetical protein